MSTMISATATTLAHAAVATLPSATVILSAADIAGEQAILKAARDLQVEAWTLLGIAWMLIILRTIGRAIAVHMTKFEVDDYLMLFAGLVYTVETIQTHYIAELGGPNNMPAPIRATRTPEQIANHITASKLFISGWVEYSSTLWLLKACMCFFYRRLFHGLTQPQRKIRFALWFVGASFIVVFVTIMAECAPFHKNWQVIPDPGQKCTQGIAKHSVVLVLNVSTDLFLISIPLPVFLYSTMPLHRKISISLLFGAGIFVTIAAILRSAFVFSDLYSSILMAQWAVRESCVSFIVGNAPMLTPLFTTIYHKISGPGEPTGPFATKDIMHSIYTHSASTLAKRKSKQQKDFMATLEDGDEEMALENIRTNHRVHHKSESMDEIYPGIKVDVEVQVQYTAASDKRNSSKKDKRMERLTTGHLAGKDKGGYTATIGLGHSAGGDNA